MALHGLHRPSHRKAGNRMKADRVARAAVGRYAWCGSAAPKTAIILVNVVSIPARISSGSVAS